MPPTSDSPSRSRREFLRKSSLALAGTFLTSTMSPAARALGAAALESPNEKLNLAYIGVMNRARANIQGTLSENCVAICDIDSNYLAGAAKKFPAAEKYSDFRKVLDRKDLEAVVVSTPDHTHAVASAAALRSGRHVYCEKPLAHSVFEARRVAELAKETGLVTQMGTQIHAGNNYRRVVELVQSGAIGTVRESHVWVGKAWDGKKRPSAKPVPPHIAYDLWLGPAPYRDYHERLLPQNWRRWWDFGGGTMADMGCHHMDLSHWALDLRAPVSVEAQGPEANPEGAPPSMRVAYDYPARGKLPALRLTWYQGGAHKPLFEKHGLPGWGDGTLFVGDKGILLADYGKYALLPEKDFKDFEAPAPFVPNSIGHYREWIDAIKTKSPEKANCNFDYSGALTESVLLGNVAHRAGKKIQWDAEKLEVTNHPEANRFVRREYRKGWSL